MDTKLFRFSRICPRILSRAGASGKPGAVRKKPGTGRQNENHRNPGELRSRSKSEGVSPSGSGTATTFIAIRGRCFTS